MARDVVDLLSVELNSSAGHKRLHSVMQIDVDETDPAAETVKTMRAERKAVAVKSGISDYEVEIQAKRFVPAEVDWHALKKSREYVTLFYEERAGDLAAERFVVEDMRVTSVSGSSDAEGNADLTIRGIALDHYKED